MNLAVRNLVRGVLGMPNGSVRPADDRSPMGGETTEMATVHILTVDDAGEPSFGYTADVNPLLVDEAVSVPRVFVASVQFYKSPTADSLGAAKQSDAAFTRAARLALLLGLSANVVTMRTAGLGFLKASQARNLTAIAGSSWESRGSVDLTFNVIARETAPVVTIGIVPLNIITQTPDQTRSSEVIAP